MRSSLAHAALLLVSLSPVVTAQTITVPTDAADLGTALAMAPPNATIYLDTTQLQAPVTITQPVTILGVDGAQIGTTGLCSSFTASPAVNLAGTGSGEVVLGGVTLLVPDNCAQTPAPLSGSGFERLRLIDCTVSPSVTGFDGYGSGSPGIDVSIPYLYLEGSSVTATNDGIDTCGQIQPLSVLSTHAGIEAPNSVVVLVNSTVRGSTLIESACCILCYCSTIDVSLVSSGGPGIVADEVHAFDSSIQGGDGLQVVAQLLIPELCGVTPSGSAFVANSVYQGPGVLTSPGIVRLGESWDIGYSNDLQGFLYISFGTQSPTLSPFYGFLHLTLPYLTPIGPLPGQSPGVLSIGIPQLPTLVGTIAAAQMLEVDFSTPFPPNASPPVVIIVAP